jgi:hypothetical protein
MDAISTSDRLSRAHLQQIEISNTLSTLRVDTAGLDKHPRLVLHKNRQINHNGCGKKATRSIHHPVIARNKLVRYEDSDRLA